MSTREGVSYPSEAKDDVAEIVDWIVSDRFVDYLNTNILSMRLLSASVCACISVVYSATRTSWLTASVHIP